ncbi:MAG: hypothetical protein B7Z55_15350, partial [Planctomycetales bacterium 12-60-4]
MCLFAASIFNALASHAHAEEIVSQDGRLKRDLVVLPGGDELLCTVQESPSLLKLMKVRLADDVWTPLHPDETRSEFEPAISRDGALAVYVQNRGNLALAVVFESLTMKEQFEIPPAGGFCGYSAPAIAPDGRTVVYSFAEGGRQRILACSPRGTDRRPLVDTDGVNNWPDFSPDGKWIVFASSRDDDFEIYRLELATGRQQRLTESPGLDIRPRFSPDGKQVAFVSRRLPGAADADVDDGRAVALGDL